MNPVPWLTPILRQAHEALILSPDAAEARHYLAARGVDPSLIVRYKLGFGLYEPTITQATPEFATYLRTAWAGRLIFPITDVFGQAIGCQSRSVSEKKYITYFGPPRDVYPFALGLGQAVEHIWRSRRVVLVEGPFDLLAVADVAPDAIAILTARAPVSLQRFLARWADRVIAMLDMDPAGRMAVNQMVGSRPRYTVSAPAYPGKDPDECRASHGRSLLVSLLQECVQ